MIVKNLYHTLFLLPIIALLVSCSKEKKSICEEQLPIVVSVNCTPDAESFQLLQWDAKQLAIRALSQAGGPYADSIDLPDAIWMPYVQYLAATREAINTVKCEDMDLISDLKVRPATSMHQLLIQLDSSSAWANVLLAGGFPTGDSIIDDLIATYDLHLEDVYHWSIGNFALLESEEPLNLQPLIAAFATHPDVIDVFANSLIGGGSDIRLVQESNSILLEYDIGKGDCPSGCIEHDIWSFRVFPNCTVAYIGFRHEP